MLHTWRRDRGCQCSGAKNVLQVWEPWWEGRRVRGTGGRMDKASDGRPAKQRPCSCREKYCEMLQLHSRPNVRPNAMARISGSEVVAEPL